VMLMDCLHLQPQPKVKSLIAIRELANPLHEGIGRLINSGFILQHATQRVHLTDRSPMSGMMLLAVIGEKIRPASKGDRPIREIPVGLFEWLLNRVDQRNRFWVACVNFIRCSPDNWAIL